MYRWILVYTLQTIKTFKMIRIPQEPSMMNYSLQLYFEMSLTLYHVTPV